MFEILTGAALCFLFLDSAGEPLHIINSSNVTKEPLLKMSLTKVPGFFLGFFNIWTYEVM